MAAGSCGHCGGTNPGQCRPSGCVESGCFHCRRGRQDYTGAWDERVDNAIWRGWWNILTGHIPPGGAVTAVSRGPNKLDVFLVSTDGGVYTAAWDHFVANGAWRGWWRVGSLNAKPGSPVGVVARAADKLDIFVAGTDGKTYTAAWDANVSNGAWRGWWNILTGHIPSGGTITAVAREANKLDIFLVSNDGGVYTAAWDHFVADGNWRGWWRIGSLNAKPGSPVGVVARAPDKLDIFVAGTDGKTYTAAWDANVANGAWRGWWNILTGHIEPGSAVAAVSRARPSWIFSLSVKTNGSTRPPGMRTSTTANGRGGGASDEPAGDERPLSLLRPQVITEKTRTGAAQQIMRVLGNMKQAAAQHGERPRLTRRKQPRPR